MSTSRPGTLDFTTFFDAVLAPSIPSSRSAVPYPYQQRLAVEPWPTLIDVPTGLGKTAAVSLAWLYKRLHQDPETPRRLLWCLPMRVLVEQTRDSIEQWLLKAGPFFEQRGLTVPTCHVLMGGDVDNEWVLHPENPAIIIGTQDMLLSRALMRGYTMSRYRWPIDFALVHHDALWVFDEVQLMGTGLATSAQLEAFRRLPALASHMPARSIWLSATLRSEWLGTVDFREHVDELAVLRLSEDEMKLKEVRRRREAQKTVQRAAIRLEKSTKADIEAYAKAVAQLVHDSHADDAPTLVILNSVDRAQQVMEELQKLHESGQSSTELVLVHARFRPAERERINERIRNLKSSDDVIVVATQAIEAGIDVTSKRLFTELAPWSSLVQRFGRCNRGGEYDERSGGAFVYWIDLNVEGSQDLALPYDLEQLTEARHTLGTLTSASAADLPSVEDDLPLTHVIRRKDFIELFNTDPDLSGHDIDISHYLRDSGQPQLHVFWREFDDQPGEQDQPVRAELCPVSIGQLQHHLGNDENKAFVWDGLGERWRSVSASQIRPGHVIMLRAADGGYDAALGFVPRLSGKRHPIAVCPPQKGAPQNSLSADPETQVGSFVSLVDHSLAVQAEAERLCHLLDETDGKKAVVQAALWHDVGKAHEAAQTAYRDFADESGLMREGLWAKTPGRGRLRYRIEQAGKVESRRYFRHELASALAWLVHGPQDTQHDLIAYLIAAHHGKVRLGIRAISDEFIPRDGRKFARGVWDGDKLPPVEFDGVVLPETILRLDVMEIGDGAMGPSWTSRTRRLLRELGPFRLAWLEMLVRIADWRASAVETALDITHSGVPVAGEGQKSPGEVSS